MLIIAHFVLAECRYYIYQVPTYIRDSKLHFVNFRLYWTFTELNEPAPEAL